VGEGFFGLGEFTRPPGGRKTGPNPTDKGKSGSKHHVVVDQEGIPLSVIHSAANIHDSKVLEEAVDAPSVPSASLLVDDRANAPRSCTPTKPTTSPDVGRL
jgi:hypothetical protein